MCSILWPNESLQNEHYRVCDVTDRYRLRRRIRVNKYQIGREASVDTNIRTPQQIFGLPIRYEIPPFQRSYIWVQEHQWEPLWDDVNNIADALIKEDQNDGRISHFMGAVVFQERSHPTAGVDTRIVVDGQQRLTTLQLLIDAVQEVFEQQNYKNPADRLSTLVANAESFLNGDRDKAFKVWPTIQDRRAFQHAMRNDLSSYEYRDSQIVKAHNFFKSQVEIWLDDLRVENGQCLESAVEAMDKALRERLELVVIDLGTSDDPHVIFETLNARGTPLLPSDMIKNLILDRAQVGNADDEQSTQRFKRFWDFGDKWWREDVGRGHQRRPRIDVFVNNWLTLRNRSETKAHDEFRAFKDYTDKQEDQGTTIDEIALDLNRIGEIYHAIEERRWEGIETFLDRRRIMDVGVITPVLLWLLSSDVPQLPLTRSLKSLESFLVRRMACCMNARGYNRLFVPLISRLQDSGPNRADETIVDYLAIQTTSTTLWPNDQALLSQFIEAPLYWSLTQGRLRLILEGIESELRTEKAETQSVPPDLHIEHILPQGWQQNWRLPLSNHEEDENAAIERRDRAIHSIGNLTLVNKKLNSSLSNAPWEQKQKTLYDHSVLYLNKSLLKCAPDLWDESAIVERAKHLHEIAVRVWPHAKAFY